MNKVYTYKSNNKTYYLNTKVIVLAGKREQRIYYFSGDYRPDTAVAEIPDGYVVSTNSRTGLPILRKVR